MTGAAAYHEATKHHFRAFARSLGYLDWASQPDPFRRFAGAPLLEAAGPIGDLLRHALGLSAWKQYGASRWALRVNPSSGNLHPTEGYVATADGIFHYAPREHALERRCQWRLPPILGASEPPLLVGLSSIHWREAWKYGERAFRYCQHDTGHAIGALSVAAALAGYRLALLPRWSHADVAALLGLDRDIDFGDAEREEPECLAVVARDVTPFVEADPASLVAAARMGRWTGAANRLSAGRVAWPIVDEVAEATRQPGWAGRFRRVAGQGAPEPGTASAPVDSIGPLPPLQARYSRALLLRRRSALGFDGRSTLPRESFVGMLRSVVPHAPPWDAIWWDPQIHLALFVHRVDGMPPGLYVFVRDPAAEAPLRAAFRPEFLWEPAGEPGLFLLVPLDCRRIAQRLSCDQEIAGDGFFSLGMIARFAPALRERGDWFYRHLFWEAGLIGQVLYLEAEAAGARATGIGCYYDDPVHDVLGLHSDDWQSLYHFSAGMPVEDARLTTEPGYAWEALTPERGNRAPRDASRASPEPPAPAR